MEDITPQGSASPVYRAKINEAQKALDVVERARIAEEQAAALETRKAPLRRLGLSDEEINLILGL
jgi:hypothetical protein